MLVRHHNKRGTAKSEHFEKYVESKLLKLERLSFGVSKVDVFKRIFTQLKYVL